MGAPDPWELLEITPEDSPAQARKAYRRLARACHPDHNPGDPEAAARFQELTEAIGAIEDPIRREKALLRRQMGPALPAGTAARGRDHHGEVRLSPPAHARGGTATARVRGRVICEACQGSGARRGGRSTPCGACRGLGMHQVGSLAVTCAECAGAGQRIEDPCPECIGGWRDAMREVQVEVPAGHDISQPVVIAGAGEPGTDQPGDLIITVLLEAGEAGVFRPRGGLDCSVHVPVSYAELCLGASVRVPTPTRTVLIDITPGTSPARPLLVRGEGLVGPGALRGDLYVHLEVWVPRRLAPAPRRLLTELRAHDPHDIRADLLRRANAERVGE